jgi:hypothetical protein
MRETRRVEALGEIALWWAVTGGIWLVTLTAWTSVEVAVAAVSTLPCAVLARLARRANGGHWRLRTGWLDWAVTVLRELPGQTVQVWMYAVVPARRRRSTIGALSLPAEPAPAASARRAVGLLALATTPATVVLDGGTRPQQLLLHRIGQRPDRLEAEVRR